MKIVVCGCFEMEVFMNLFSKLFRSRDKPTNHLGGLSFLFGQTAAGKAVNERTAMQTTAVYACVRILANPSQGYLFTSMPIKVRAKSVYRSIRCISCSTMRRTQR